MDGRGDARAGTGIGEIIGASQREERLEVLDRSMAERGIDREHYACYRDLRRYRTVPHAGFGLAPAFAGGAIAEAGQQFIFYRAGCALIIVG